MKKIKTFLDVDLPDFFTKLMVILKVIFYEVLIILVAFGILYLTNFRIRIEPMVKIISPIVETK